MDVFGNESQELYPSTPKRVYYTKKFSRYGKNEFIGYTFSMEIEKRKFYRHPIKVPIQLAEVPHQKTSTSRSEDLSQGGLSFFWPDFIPQGTHLKLSIPVEKQLFKMNAHVAYCQKDGMTGLFKTGVMFEDSESAFRAKLAEEILQIQDYRTKMSELRGQPVSETEAAQEWIGKNAESFARLIGQN
mgnify:CR=1 FL=1